MNPIPALIAIRPMTAEDVEWAQRLADASPNAPRWPAAAYLTAVDPQSLPRRIALLAESPKTVPKLGRFGGPITPKLGFAAASLLPPQAELETIVVAPEARRQGVARELFSTLADELRSAGVVEITLEARASNLPALKLYQSLGFAESGRRPRYYIDPVEDAVLMRLALA
jgi:ribosomal protein S18 acetylase RimI-like enzyme